MTPMLMLDKTVPAKLSFLIAPISANGNIKPITVEAYINKVIKSPKIHSPYLVSLVISVSLYSYVITYSTLVIDLKNY